MKIIRLSATNVLRLKAVEIEPGGTVQVVTGRNAQGKSSVLNAIWLALGGGAASRDVTRPIRAGEDHAQVTLDLGDPDGTQLVVTRTWDEKGTKLTVKAGDGATYRSPQTLLDQLVGKLSFDPLAFTRLSAREQREALLDLLGLDFTAADRERARLYDERLETGRKAHAFGELPRLAKDAPTREVPATEILDRINTAQVWQRNIDHSKQVIRQGVINAETIEAQIERLTATLGDIRRGIAQEQERLADLPEPEDMDILRAELAGIEDRNKTARENARILRDRERQKAHEDRYTALGQQIATLDNAKAKAIAAAEMPVAGLGFDDTGVLFGGVPFGQASSAEQIRVSLAMAMNLNPTLRVIRIMDGSLLDSDSLAAITEMATEHNFQVLLEMVGDTAEGSAVLIEDGEVSQ